MSDLICGWYYRKLANPQEAISLKSQYTVMCTKGFGANTETIAVPVYDESRQGYLGIPLRQGMNLFSKMPQGTCDFSYYQKFKTELAGPDLKHKDAHPEQPILVQGVLDSLEKSRACMLVAPTGAGKTIMSIAIACRLNTPTLVVVHREVLVNQWRSDLVTKAGFRPEQVGQLGGGVIDVEGKRVVIAMLQTIYDNSKYDKYLKNKFGFVVFDEVHNLGAPKLCRVLGKVNAKYQMGVTATENRKDKQHVIYKMFFGSGDLKASSPALPLKVIAVPYTNGVLRGRKISNRTAILRILTSDPIRNRLICRWAAKLHSQGRNILIVSEYKKHLQLLAEGCFQYGIPKEDMGHFYHGGETFDVNNKLKRSAYFKNLQISAKVIFATYGMVKEGVSINRLDAGIDATPRSEVTQLFGRIRRPFQGKRTPVWVHLLDKAPYMLSKMGDNRLAECKRDKAVQLVLVNAK